MDGFLRNLLNSKRFSISRFLVGNPIAVSVLRFEVKNRKKKVFQAPQKFGWVGEIESVQDDIWTFLLQITNAYSEAVS